MSRIPKQNVQKLNKGGGERKMKTLRAFMAVAAAFAVIGLSSSAATAVTFDVDVAVGWLDATGTCSAGNTCLGFNGAGGFGAGSSLILNWDDATAAGDSFLRVGALPDDTVFPSGTGSTTIDPGQTVRTAQIQHENNVLPGEDNDLAQITLRTLLEITGPGGEIILDENNGGLLDVVVDFEETLNQAGTCPGSVGPPCDDVFTFITIEADIPFEFEGVNYILQVRGLLDEFGNPTCTDAGGGTVECFTEEQQINDRFVEITLIQLSVPAPASLLLVGLGLVGAGVLPIIRKRLSA